MLNQAPKNFTEMQGKINKEMSNIMCQKLKQKLRNLFFKPFACEIKMSHYKKNKGSLFSTYHFLSSVVRGSSRMNDYDMPEFIHLKTSV